MTAAACLLLAAAGAATSQTLVQNNQVLTGDVFATQSLNVVGIEESTSVITPATGNTFTGSAVGVDIDIVSVQSVQANVGADALLTVVGSSGETTVLSTAAIGNSAEANGFYSASILGDFTQDVGAFEIRAGAEYDGPTGRTGALTSSTQAIANSLGVGLISSEATAAVTQSSAALVQADDGGVLQYTDGVALFSALAAGNNLTGVGDTGTRQAYDVTQSQTGQRVQASVFVSAGNAQDITAQSTVTGNNISITSEDLPLEVVADQANTSYIRSEAHLSSFDWGAATASAYGVGNSTMAGNFGPSTVLHNTQVNSGGVEVLASFTGDTGYDAYLASTAIGNAATGYVCSECPPGRLTVTNSQTNSGGVSAYGTTTIGSTGRVVQSLTAATGNSGTFYVSSPD